MLQSMLPTINKLEKGADQDITEVLHHLIASSGVQG